MFLQSLYWSLGAGLEDADRTRFNDLMRDCGGLPGLADEGDRMAKGGEFTSSPTDQLSTPLISKQSSVITVHICK